MATAIGIVAVLLAVGLVLLHLPAALVIGGIAVLGSAAIHAAQGAGPVGALAAAGETVLTTLTDLSAAELAVLPLFVLLGNVALYAGIATRIYDAAAVWLRPLRGGAAMASVLGCAGFAALSGASVACAATMGRICVPEMLRIGYDPRLAASSVAVGGTLGALIPPSIPFIVYGLISDSSIAALFMAGLLPGLLSLAGMLLAIGWWVAEHPADAPAAPPAGAGLGRAALAALPAMALFGIIVGGIFAGVLSPVAAAAVCILLATAIGLAQHRLTAELLWHALRDSAVQSAAILAVVVAARLFLDFVALAGLAEALARTVLGAGPGYFGLMGAIVAACLVMGMFLDPLAVLVLTLPFTLPLIDGAGLDPVWFGVIVVKLVEIGLITPPVGLNVFVIANVARGIGTDRIFAGVVRFLAIDLLVLLVLVMFPVISTFVPGMMPP